MSALALRTRAILLFGIVLVFHWHCESTKNEAELFLMSRLKSIPHHTLEGDGTAPESSITLPFNPFQIDPFEIPPSVEFPESDLLPEFPLLKPIEIAETEMMRFSVPHVDDINLLTSLPPADAPPLQTNLDLLSSHSSISFSSLSHNEEPIAVVIDEQGEGLDVVPDIPLPDFLSNKSEECGEPVKLLGELPPIERKKRAYIKKPLFDETTELTEEKMRKYLENAHKITGRAKRNKLLEQLDEDIFGAPSDLRGGLQETLKKSMDTVSKFLKTGKKKEVSASPVQQQPEERELPRADFGEPLFEEAVPPCFLEREYMIEEDVIQKSDSHKIEESESETIVSFTKDTAKLLRHLQKKVPGSSAIQFTDCLPRAARSTAAKAFYHLMELASIGAVSIQQPHHYAPITLNILMELTNPQN